MLFVPYSLGSRSMGSGSVGSGSMGSGSMGSGSVGSGPMGSGSGSMGSGSGFWVNGFRVNAFRVNGFRVDTLSECPPYFRAPFFFALVFCFLFTSCGDLLFFYICVWFFFSQLVLTFFLLTSLNFIPKIKLYHRWNMYESSIPCQEPG